MRFATLAVLLVAALPAAAQPDLRISGVLEPGDEQADPGDRVTLEYTVFNGGNVDVEETSVAFYLSTDAVFDSGDTFIEAESLGSNVEAGEVEEESEQVTLPGVPDGDYYVLLIVDPNDFIAETDETNNVASDEIQIGDGGGGTAVIGEAGTFRRGLQRPGQFYAVDLSRTYAQPVVVTGGLASSEPDSSATVRVAAVRPTSFFVQVDEWDALDGEQAGVEVPYLVVEAGVHTLADGRRVEAGVVTTNANGAARVTYSAAFDGRPVLFTQVVTTNNAEALAPRVRGRAGQFRVDLVTQEASPGPSRPEQVAWVAIAPGPGTADGKPYEATVAGRLGSDPRIVRFAQTVGRDAVALAATQAVAEADPATVRILRQGRIGVELVLQEETSADAETAHPGELLGVAVFAPGPISATTAARAPAPSASVTSPAVLALAARPNPTVGRATLDLSVSAAGAVRLDVFDMTGRRVLALADGPREAGTHAVALDASGLPAGVYLVRATTEAGRVASVPLTVVR